MKKLFPFSLFQFPVLQIGANRLLTVTVGFCLLVAQFEATGQPPIGIRIGVGNSSPNVRFDPSISAELTAESRMGLVLGLYTQFPLRPGWTVQPGLQLTSKGYKDKYDGSYYYSSNRVRYLEVPVNFIYSSKPGGNGFQAGGGPVISYLEPEYQQDRWKKFDVGGSLLLGYAVPIGFSLQLQYTHGLLNGIKQPSMQTSLKNRYLALSAGYLF